MSWIRDSTLNWAHLLCARVLKCGVIPKHVAFIMDGNRRFAKKINVEKVEGHTRGFDKLSETLQWCLDLGIKEVTVYAFSIENFKRSDDEVNGLMNLARGKFSRLLEERDQLAEKGVRIKIFGDTSLLPEDIRAMITKVEDMTRRHSNAFLNVAFSYTAQDEMTKAINMLVQGIRNGKLECEDLTISLFEKCLYTADSNPPDIIIRTSGESRLSDFLLFQGSFSYLEFIDVLWPELSAWHFLSVIFKYQCALRTLQHHKDKYLLPDILTSRSASFLSLASS